MVASLQHKKEALEAKIRDKTSELRKLCIEEAELTGVLPAETPLEPGESPPEFRRRVGTSFTYPESLINKLRSKEDEALAALELECKIQNGIAEAALGLANDVTANKSVRRKHRLLYEESQRRLQELEARLNSLRLSQPKQKKKPRPQTDMESDCVDGVEADNHSDHGRFINKTVHMGPVPEPGTDKYTSGILKNSQTFSGFQKSDQNLYPHHQRLTQSNMVLPNMIMQNMDYRHSVMVPEFHHHLIRSSNASPSNDNWWSKGRELSHGAAMRQSPLTNSPDYYIEPNVISDRFGSLDRNIQPLPNFDLENRMSSTLPRNAYMAQGTNVAPSVLLPSQTYPENSLMRTQSLGSVDNSKHPERKAKEKEWYESSLDSSPPKVVPKRESPISPNQNEESTSPYPFDNNNSRMNQASINSIHFDTVVPYESPKNHTVVEAGKWQPYREITKPFEMSDFYKYSVKYRKGQTQGQNQSHEASSPQQLQLLHQQQYMQQQMQQQLQQKGIYKPLQRLECQPLPQNSGDTYSLKGNSQGNPSQTDSRYSSELITWYNDKSSSPKPRSSTLV